MLYLAYVGSQPTRLSQYCDYVAKFLERVALWVLRTQYKSIRLLYVIRICIRKVVRLGKNVNVRFIEKQNILV